MFTLLVSGSQKPIFSSGLETIQGGALRPWEYPEPIPEASRAPKHAENSHFQNNQKSKLLKFWKSEFLACFGALEASGVGSGYSQGLSAPPWMVSRPLEKFDFWDPGTRSVNIVFFDLMVAFRCVFNCFHYFSLKNMIWDLKTRSSKSAKPMPGTIFKRYSLKNYAYHWS